MVDISSYTNIRVNEYIMAATDNGARTGTSAQTLTRKFRQAIE
jgi:hypothetical protein